MQGYRKGFTMFEEGYHAKIQKIIESYFNIDDGSQLVLISLYPRFCSRS